MSGDVSQQPIHKQVTKQDSLVAMQSNQHEVDVLKKLDHPNSIPNSSISITQLIDNALSKWQQAKKDVNETSQDANEIEKEDVCI